MLGRLNNQDKRSRATAFRFTVSSLGRLGVRVGVENCMLHISKAVLSKAVTRRSRQQNTHKQQNGLLETHTKTGLKLNVVAVAGRRVRERGAVCSDCGCVSSATMAVTLFTTTWLSKLFGAVLEGLCNSPFPPFFFKTLFVTAAFVR